VPGCRRPRYGPAWEYALGLGLVYVLVALWGFIIGDGESILGFIPINTEDNVLHLVIGLAGLAAGWASRPAAAGAAPSGPSPAH
jgi:hypothetical protein